MRAAPMRIEVAEPIETVSTPFAVFTTIELPDASYFSSVPVTECAAAFFAGVLVVCTDALVVCAGAADADAATATAKTLAPSNWNMRDMDGTSSAGFGSHLDRTKSSAT